MFLRSRLATVDQSVNYLTIKGHLPRLLPSINFSTLCNQKAGARRNLGPGLMALSTALYGGVNLLPSIAPQLVDHRGVISCLQYTHVDSTNSTFICVFQLTIQFPLPVTMRHNFVITRVLLTQSRDTHPD